MRYPSQLFQDIVELVLPRISGTLSILGSSAIMVSMIIDRRKLKSSFNRLLFMLCCFDICTSSGCVWSASALPKDDNYHVYGAQGNWITCRMHGYILQLGTAVPMYFYFLTIHYLLVIRYGMKEERIRRTFEPFMHLFASGFAIGTATAGLILELYNPDGNACWISEYPKGCFSDDSEIECIHGANATIYRFIFGGIPTGLPLFLVPLTMGLIVWTVRKQTLKMNRYNPNSILHASTSTTTRRSFISGHFTSTDNFSSDFALILNLRRKAKCKTTERLKAVAHQALAYTFCYLIVYIWPIIMFIIITENKNIPIPVGVLYNLFYPLQGFLNYMVHIRPFVVKIRKRDPEMSILRAMFVVTFPKRPGRRTTSISICHEINCCCRKPIENKKNSEANTGDSHVEANNEADQDNSKECDRSEEEELDPEDEEEDIDQSETIVESSGDEDGERALVAAITRAASYKSERGLDAEEQEIIKQEKEYFEAVAELSKITGNYF